MAKQDTQLPGDPSLPSPPEVFESYIRLAEDGHKYAVEDFFRKPERSRYQLSPSGKYFSFLGPWKRRLNIFIQEPGSEQAVRITSIEDRDIAWYFWKTDETLLFARDKGGDENFHLYAIERDGSNLRELTPFDSVRVDLVDDLEDFPDEVIIQMNKSNPHLFDPYRLNIKTGELTQLAQNDNLAEPIDNWITDHQGRLRAATKLVGGTNTCLLYRRTENEVFKEVITTDFRVSIVPLFFDFENEDRIYVSTNLGRDKSVITRFNLATGLEEGPVIFEHPEVDVSSLAYSRKRKVLTAITYLTDKRHLHFLDAEVKAIYQRLESALGDYEIVIADHNRDEDKFMVRTYSDRSLGAYYFFDKNAGELLKVATVSPWLDETHMAEMTPVSYRSRDGLTIHGYLTLPQGHKGAKLPVVVNPHGGPWVRDVWGYNPEVQLLASRGFAVFQMNYRGSTGYGRHFWEISFKQWGRKMQDDISDGVQWLIEQGIADPARVAIYGGSYGGYATLAGLTFTPDLYACGVDYVGVSNLFTFLTTIPPYWKPYLEMMYEMVGHPEKDKELLRAASPVFHIDRIKAPLFVAQGANDPRVNIDESDQIVKALRQRGIDVPYMVKYDEGHGFHNEENQFEFYKAMLGFLVKYLKG